MLELIVAASVLGGLLVLALVRAPTPTAPRDGDSEPDLPCPWCGAATSEQDPACPGCHQPFGQPSPATKHRST